MNKYVYKPYSSTFPKLFEREKQRISDHISQTLHIEHVGSTAVPNLGGKGIIDLAIAVNKTAMEAISVQLQQLGYVFNPKGSTPDRLFFYANLPDAEEGTRRYHIHLTHPESKDWKNHLHFRDFLREHPQETEEYAELKRKAAQEASQDGETYRKLKAPLFEKILEHS